MGEFDLIRRYFAAAPCASGGEGVVRGIGDDCALLALPTGHQLAISTDTLVCGVHFPADADPFLLGQRALAVAVSDLAAMGAKAQAFTLALTLPDASEHWLQGFAQGLQRMAEHCAIALVGGDTTRGPLTLTLTVLGHVPAGSALRRDGAQVGDVLCVGGSLGDGAGALPLVLANQPATCAAEAYLLERYWAPQPQLALGLALRGRATAALDISDGLLADCGHIASASKVALLIEQQALPLADELLQVAGTHALGYALSGGDDYRLAFTLPAQHLAWLSQHYPQARCIGRVEAGEGVHLLDAQGRTLTAAQAGYQHF